MSFMLPMQVERWHMLLGGRAASLLLFPVRHPASPAVFMVFTWCRLPCCQPITSDPMIQCCQPAASLCLQVPNPTKTPNPNLALLRLQLQEVHGPACPAQQAPRGIGPFSCLASAASRHRQLRCDPRSYCCP